MISRVSALYTSAFSVPRAAKFNKASSVVSPAMPTMGSIKASFPFRNTGKRAIGRSTGSDVVDAVGNRQDYHQPDLAALGFPNTLSVTSTQDTTPPALQDFSFSPTAIDTTSGEQVVTVTAHATDDLSGVSVIYVSFLSPSGSQIQQGIISRISGNANDGIYQGFFSFPQYGEAGNWSVNSIYIVDAVGNPQDYRQPDLAALGFPRQVGSSATPTPTPTLTPTPTPAPTPNPTPVPADSYNHTFATRAHSLTDSISDAYTYSRIDDR